MSSCLKKAILAIEIIISLAIVATAMGLLIAGHECYYNRTPLINNNANCEGVYISGILMMFLIGCLLMFALFACIVDRIDMPRVSNAAPVVVVKNPKSRRQSIVTSV